jgi:hypothetical protein
MYVSTRKTVPGEFWMRAIRMGARQVGRSGGDGRKIECKLSEFNTGLYLEDINKIYFYLKF